MTYRSAVPQTYALMPNKWFCTMLSRTHKVFISVCNWSTGGSVVEFSPATRETRVRFPASAWFCISSQSWGADGCNYFNFFHEQVIKLFLNFRQIIFICCAYLCEWSYQPTMTDVECQARRVHVANVLLAGPPLPNFSPKESKGKKRYSRNWKE